MGTSIYCFELIDNNMHFSMKFNSANQASKFFNCADTTIKQYVKHNKLFKQPTVVFFKLLNNSIFFLSYSLLSNRGGKGRKLTF